jgi:hypothetical protein
MVSQATLLSLLGIINSGGTYNPCFLTLILCCLLHVMVFVVLSGVHPPPPAQVASTSPLRTCSLARSPSSSRAPTAA